MEISQKLKLQADVSIRNGTNLFNSFANQSRQNVVLWLDLLGFQSQLMKNPDKALLRIAIFHELTITSMSDEIDIVQLNDATVISMDFSNNDDPERLTVFLAKCDILFEKANYADKKVGGYGIRGVISIGQRQGLRGNFGTPQKTKTPSISMDVKQIRFSSPIAIMMNLAFAKSYLFESSGMLLKQSSLYVEKRIATDYKIKFCPKWENYGETNFKDTVYMNVRKEGESKVEKITRKWKLINKIKSLFK